jgi:carboxylate-amine ligase
MRDGTSADRQLATYDQTGDLKAVVDRLIAETAEGVRPDVAIAYAARPGVIAPLADAAAPTVTVRDRGSQQSPQLEAR